MSEAFRLVVDAARCDGHGICALRCPELITLDRWGYAGVDAGAVATGRMLRRARLAAAACPERAITLVPTAPAPVAHPTAHPPQPGWHAAVSAPPAPVAPEPAPRGAPPAGPAPLAPPVPPMPAGPRRTGPIPPFVLPPPLVLAPPPEPPCGPQPAPRVHNRGHAGA